MFLFIFFICPVYIYEKEGIQLQPNKKKLNPTELNQT